MVKPSEKVPIINILYGNEKNGRFMSNFSASSIHSSLLATY
jgi:hypothetical protein